MATGIADRVYLVSKGQMAYEGTPSDFLPDDEATAKHLGAMAEAGATLRALGVHAPGTIVA